MKFDRIGFEKEMRKRRRFVSALDTVQKFIIYAHIPDDKLIEYVHTSKQVPLGLHRICCDTISSLGLHWGNIQPKSQEEYERFVDDFFVDFDGRLQIENRLNHILRSLTQD